jgi:signal transduction histidine kinase
MDRASRREPDLGHGAAAIVKAFHGLTRRRLAVLAGFGLLYCAFNWPVATSYARGLPVADIALAFVQTYLGTCVWFFAGLFAAVAVYNLTSGPVAARIVVAVIALAVAVACVLSLAYAIQNAPTYDVFAYKGPPGFAWLMNSVLVGVAAAALLLVTHSDDVERALESEALRAIDLERGLDEARLQATQAQIEPHFLFNTLANIRRLYQVDGAGACAMLRQFALMLGRSLPQIRNPRSTLGREVALAMAYLHVQKIRMGERLDFATQIPAALVDADLPPMMLSTLVENAIKHGLAPLRRGGRVEIAAERDGATLRVRVTDNGRGLTESAGSGLGLANIEARLAAAFGAEGALTLEPGEHGGVIARLAVPLQFYAIGARDPDAHA